MLTFNDLILAFSELGVEAGDILLVHSSYKSFGGVEGGPQTVIDSLLDKAFLACRMKRIRVLSIGGGVAANQRLRSRFSERAKRENIQLQFSPLEFCTDNAAMVALLGYFLIKKGKIDNPELISKI